jgi:uncharacterized membrane-anchored protein
LSRFNKANNGYDAGHLISQPKPAMTSLASILSLLITALVFFFTARYINRAMAEKGIPSGMVRGVLVVFLASVVALFAGAAVDWVSATHPAAVNATK